MIYVNINPKKTHCAKRGLIRIKTYSIDLIFDYIKNNPLESKFDPKLNKVNPGSYYIDEDGNHCKLKRARSFFEMGVDCVKCSVKANLFSLDLWPDGSLHFDLYGLNELGEEVLMTVDHIQAKSNGGKNHISNYQPLCKCCNEIKSNS